MTNDPDIESIYCSTGQHKELLHSVLIDFDIKLDIELDAMSHNQSLSLQAAYMMTSLQEIVDRELPDLIIVQGDTMSAYCGASVAFYNKIRLAHIEAGLRTGNKHGPYPEEVHRKYIDDVSDIHFAHSEMARQTLLTEGHLTDTVYMTGNTGIDALLAIREKLNIESLPLNQNIVKLVERLKQSHSKLALLTLHRRETSGSQQIKIIKSIIDCAEQLDLRIIMLTHPNPMLKDNISAINGNYRIELIDPLSYSSFVWLMTQMDVIYTDSGGIQEEAPYLGKKVVVLRNETERHEVIGDGINQLYNSEGMLETTKNILSSEQIVMTLYGNGDASQEILTIIKKVS